MYLAIAKKQLNKEEATIFRAMQIKNKQASYSTNLQ